jgi:hypothetical protein
MWDNLELISQAGTEASPEKCSLSSKRQRFDNAQHNISQRKLLKVIWEEHSSAVSAEFRCFRKKYESKKTKKEGRKKRKKFDPMKIGKRNLFRPMSKYRMYHLKPNPNHQVLRKRKEIKGVLLLKWTLSIFRVILESLPPWLLGCCCRQLRRRSTGASVVYWRKERVIILEHHFALKSFTAVSEALSNSCYTVGWILLPTVSHRWRARLRRWSGRRIEPPVLSTCAALCSFLQLAGAPALPNSLTLLLSTLATVNQKRSRAVGRLGVQRDVRGGKARVLI